MANSLEQTPTPAAEDDEWNYHNCLTCHRRVPINDNLPGIICRHCDYRFLQFEVPSQNPQSEDELFGGETDSSSSDGENEDSEDDDISDSEAEPPSLDSQSEDDDLEGSEFNGSDEENNDDDESEEIERENNEGANSSNSTRVLFRSWLESLVHERYQDVWPEPDFRRRYLLRHLARQLLNRSSSNPPQTDFVADHDFDEVLNTLAEADNGRKGAPPAAKLVISGLPTVKILTEADGADCAICQDVVGVGELMKKLPCGHGYHGECIVTWLGDRNSCPVCRFELPTDDVEYEDMRKNGRNRGRTEEISE